MALRDSVISSMASAECAVAAPAHISAATQIAPMSSCSAAPFINRASGVAADTLAKRLKRGMDFGRQVLPFL